MSIELAMAFALATGAFAKPPASAPAVSAAASAVLHGRACTPPAMP